MKKLNVLLLSVVALGITTVSCSKDDKNTGLKVPVGKWAYDQVTETTAGATSQPNAINDPSCTDIRYLNFKTGGAIEDGYVDSNCAFTAYQGTYTQSGGVVNIVETDGYKLTYTLLSVSATKMTVKEIIDPADPTHFYTLTFNKK